MEAKKLFTIHHSIPHESGGFVVDTHLVTGPETQRDIEIIDFYMSIGAQAISIHECNVNPPKQVPEAAKETEEPIKFYDKIVLQ